MTPSSETPSTSRQPRIVFGLACGALGVVFGDIGTSPLYALQTAFNGSHSSVTPSRQEMFGVVSMVFWAITIVVSYGYAALMLRADKDGEGGILSLVALLRRKVSDRPRLLLLVLVLGVIGAALFYGDSVIAPAISVMSAVGGLSIIDARFHVWVLPLSLLVLGVLFGVQRCGSGHVGRFFGPVMATWFISLGALGLPHVLRERARHPGRHFTAPCPCVRGHPARHRVRRSRSGGPSPSLVWRRSTRTWDISGPGPSVWPGSCSGGHRGRILRVTAGSPRWAPAKPKDRPHLQGGAWPDLHRVDHLDPLHWRGHPDRGLPEPGRAGERPRLGRHRHIDALDDDLPAHGSLRLAGPGLEDSGCGRAHPGRRDRVVPCQRRQARLRRRARYFVSTIRLTSADVPTLPRWRRGLFLWLAHNAADRTAAFHLPIERSVVVGGRLEV